VCEAIVAHDDLELLLIAGGMHLDTTFGRTIDDIRAEGFHVSSEVAWDTTAAPAWHQIGAAARGVGDALASTRPDALLVVGDRFETAAAVLAATTLAMPVAHLHGGEETRGAFDDQIRHAITKLSHLHLVASKAAGERIVAMGEDPQAVRVVGPPGTDLAWREDLPRRDDLERALGLELEPPVVIVSVHATTLASAPDRDARAVAAALDSVEATYVITLPNADPGGGQVRDVLLAAADRPRRIAVRALGDRRHWGLLKVADAMVGNSSSAIIEAPVVGLPVVNVGERQLGRESWGTVSHVDADPVRIASALRDAIAIGRTTPQRPPSVDGHAGDRVAEALAAWKPESPPRKAPIRRLEEGIHA
jgi:UDP-hydrolysing UDP-N-acetyl-D-glucosamine 2-epimerase